MTGYRSRVDALLALILSSLDAAEPRGVAALAGRAHLSRAHATRAFSRLLGESPAALRRRLLLERAAWTLTRSGARVTDVALDAGFESLEAFTRAFRRAYGTSPSLYRRAAPGHHHLSAPNGIHYAPTGATPKEDPMDLLDHLLRFDEAFVRQAIAQARALPDGALDRPLGESQPLTFEPPDTTLRALLDKLVLNKEVWVAAVRGGALPPEDRDRSPDGLEARLNLAFPAFREVALEVSREQRWRQGFVDALCEPPEVFPFGGMIAHVLTVDAHRRHTLSAWFWRLGVQLDADPMHFGGPVQTPPRAAGAAEVRR